MELLYANSPERARGLAAICLSGPGPLRIVRLSAVPYVMTLIGAGEQRLVMLTPFLEGVSNFLASIVAGNGGALIGKRPELIALARKLLV